MVGAVVLLTAAGGYAIGRELFRPRQRVVQPIAFSHEKHVGELEMECTQCHEFVESGKHAGLPALTTCLDCHEEALTENPEELKIQTLAQDGENDVFRKLFRLADHAFYSHRAHVGGAGLPCETCHGAIAQSTAPPERPLIRISMGFCIDCHEKSGASTDCTRCQH